jgi:hypothetical protein
MVASWTGVKCARLVGTVNYPLHNYNTVYLFDNVTDAVINAIRYCTVLLYCALRMQSR